MMLSNCKRVETMAVWKHGSPIIGFLQLPWLRHDRICDQVWPNAKGEGWGEGEGAPCSTSVRLPSFVACCKCKLRLPRQNMQERPLLMLSADLTSHCLHVCCRNTEMSVINDGRFSQNRRLDEVASRVAVKKPTHAEFMWVTLQPAAGTVGSFLTAAATSSMF